MKDRNSYFEEIKSYKLLANKSLGQNFLINPDTAESIVSTLDIADGEKVLEIGAGLGSLSYFLASCNASNDLIDVDERMLTYLENHFSDKSNITIRRQNILKEDLSSYDKIIGNLPYYITSGIIEKLLLEGVNCKKFVLMTQKEVYPKLLKNFVSPLSLFLNYVCEISSAKPVGRNNFAPVPHVDSVYFSLTPNKNIKNEDNKLLYKLICKLFLLRRKTILNNLDNVIKDKKQSEEILASMNVNLQLRPEQLDINFYRKLLELLKSKNLSNKI